MIENDQSVYFEEEAMKNKKLWFQIIAWGLCIVIGYKLYSIVQADNINRIELYSQLQQQANAVEETEYEKLESLTDVYDKLYSEIHVPDFICWGDSAMAGSREKSLPISMQKVIEENLFSDLSKTFSRVLENEEYKLPSVTVNNMGVTNEGMRQILVRAGVNIMDLGEGIEIPTGTDPVNVRLMDEEAWNSIEDDKNAQLKFAKQRDVGFGKVRISGVEGTLITTDDWFDSSHPGYAFIRDEEGDWQRVGSGTEVEIETATEYLGDIPVFFFENDSGRSVDGLVSDIDKLVKRYANTNVSEDVSDEADSSLDEEESVTDEEGTYNLPYVVVCTTTEGSALDKALLTKFGNTYIRNDGYSADMTDRTYKKLAQQIYDNLDQQGCFSDIQAKIILAVQEAGGI